MILLRVLSWIVPSARRAGWRAEWEAELWELRRRREGGGAFGRRLVAARFVVGAVPHALWERREEWTVDGVFQDVRFAVRTLRRAPAFTLTAVITLGVGLGANAAILSMINGLLFRPPAGLQEADELVHVGRAIGAGLDAISHPLFASMREDPAFEGVTVYGRRGFVVGSGSDARMVPGRLVSSEYFDVLGVRAIAGRFFTLADDRTLGEGAVVVLSRRFGGPSSGEIPP